MSTADGPVAGQPCFHCGLPVPASPRFPVTINSKQEWMCCPGCQAVATAIVDGGLDNFYRFRTSVSTRPEVDNTLNTHWSIYDLPEIQADFVTPLEDEQDIRQANLLLEGITCAACSWLIETHMKKQAGVQSVTINVTTHRCTLVWSGKAQTLSTLMAALADIGYSPRPATDEQQQELVRKENRMALMRIGVAGFGMMQAMMVAVGMYTGASEFWVEFLRWQSLIAATPVILFSAQPFFKTAWRSLKAGQLVMDVPVALAMGLAYVGSVYATVRGTGEIYFESVSMFAFFLLLGRYIEMRARHKNRQAFGNLAQLMPLTACCLPSDNTHPSLTELNANTELQQVPLKLLRPGDRVLVRAGETFPCDGVVEDGQSSAVEAILTGESIPVAKQPGDQVIAGTLNNDSSLVVSVSATGAATRLSAIERLAAQASSEKPVQVTMADRIARFFIARLLVICVAVFAFWCWYDASRAFWVTLSVLVVTCPCALALAMPAALSAATANLRKRGFLIARGHVIESLTGINRVVFDKTGTLTRGQFVIQQQIALGSIANAECLILASALELRANHPLSAAFDHEAALPEVQQFRQITAAGVEGFIEGKHYRLGRPDFVVELYDASHEKTVPALPDSEKTWLLLANTDGPLAWFGLVDEIRPGAKALVQALRADGIAVALLSGDQSGAVAHLATALGIETFVAGASPDDKLSHLHTWQQQGDKVLMMGDGINDVPVLSGADVSVAMAAASDLAQTRADSVLLNDDLMVVHEAMVIARRTRRIIKQNLRFSLAYNILALPLASAGWIAPWMAAIGMTASSLVVIFNSLRLNDSDQQK
jgi:Cu2+-exporting ATPase